MLKDFSHYTVKEKLNSQCDLAAYLAFDKNRNKSVIIKELPSYISDQTIIDTYLSKVNSKSMLKNELYVETYEIQSIENKSYLIREYLNSPSLETSLLTTKYTIDSLISLFLEIAKSLRKLHKDGIHHLNLKPSNIFLLSDNQYCFTDPYPIDYSVILQQAGIVNQSIYTAPEISTGGEIKDSADIYSLGLIFLQFMSCIENDPASYPTFPTNKSELSKFMGQVSMTISDELRLMLEMMIMESPSGRLKSTKILISTLNVIKSSMSSKELVSDTNDSSLNKQSRKYLAIAILVVLIIIFWIVITSLPK